MTVMPNTCYKNYGHTMIWCVPDDVILKQCVKFCLQAIELVLCVYVLRWLDILD